MVIAGNHDITFDKPYYERQPGGGRERFHANSGDIPLDCERVREQLLLPDGTKKAGGAKSDSSLCSSIIYLEDSATEVIGGYQVYGSPWQPEFCDWAFNLPRGGEQLRSQWAKIPEAIDILMTHTPAKGFCDRTSSGVRVGCEELLRAIQQRTVSVSLAGHIHDAYGCDTDELGTLYINASTCTHNYRPVNPPIVFDAPPLKDLREATSRAKATAQAQAVRKVVEKMPVEKMPM